MAARVVCCCREIATEIRLQPPSTHDNADARSATVRFAWQPKDVARHPDPKGSAKDLLATLDRATQERRRERAGADRSAQEKHVGNTELSVRAKIS